MEGGIKLGFPLDCHVVIIFNDTQYWYPLLFRLELAKLNTNMKYTFH